MDESLFTIQSKEKTKAIKTIKPITFGILSTTSYPNDFFLMSLIKKVIELIHRLLSLYSESKLDSKVLKHSKNSPLDGALFLYEKFIQILTKFDIDYIPSIV